MKTKELLIENERGWKNLWVNFSIKIWFIFQFFVLMFILHLSLSPWLQLNKKKSTEIFHAFAISFAFFPLLHSVLCCYSKEMEIMYASRILSLKCFYRVLNCWVLKPWFLLTSSLSLSSLCEREKKEFACKWRKT